MSVETEFLKSRKNIPEWRQNVFTAARLEKRRERNLTTVLCSITSCHRNDHRCFILGAGYFREMTCIFLTIKLKPLAGNQ